MENNLLPNSAITASSVWRHVTGHESWRARLNNLPNGHAGCWVAGNNKVGEWLQIDLRKERLLTKLATQGRPASNQRVTSYSLWLSSDNVKWEEYKENGVVKRYAMLIWSTRIPRDPVTEKWGQVSCKEWAKGLRDHMGSLGASSSSVCCSFLLLRLVLRAKRQTFTATCPKVLFFSMTVTTLNNLNCYFLY